MSKTMRFVAKYHEAQSEYAIHRLPFMAAPGAGAGETYFWALPANGGYGDGCAAGKVAALAWLKAHRESARLGGGSLQALVLAMTERIAKARGRERTVLRGHIVGFFSELDAWAAAAAKWEAAGGVLDALTESEVCKRLQDAADCGPSERDTRELKANASARGRAAAKVRWAARKRAA